jgi:drug/metabolite transporter (DMT)-like permease
MASPKGGAAKRSLVFPWVLLLGGAVAYSSAFSANRFAFEAGFPFLAYSFWQSLFGAVALLVASVFFRSLPPIGAAPVRLYALTAIVGFSVPLLALTFAAGKLPPAVVPLVVTLVPALTYIFALALRTERFQALSVAGLLLGMAGVVLIIVLPEGSLGAGVSAGWLILALAAPLGYAVNNVAVPFLRPAATNSLQLSTGVLVVGAIVLLPVTLIVDGPVSFTSMPAMGIVAMFWAAAANVGIFLCLFEIIRLAGPVFFSQFNYVVVAAGIAWGVIFFPQDSAFSPWVWAAVAVMAVGLVLANAGINKANREAAAGD